MKHKIHQQFPFSPVSVISFGGTGSKMLVKWLYPDTELEVKKKAHHHSRTPPLEVQEGQKIIYSFGDPRNSLVSFFQRRESITNQHGFQSNSPKSGNKDWVVRALNELETESDTLNSDWDLKTYLENGVDYFKFQDHFNNWFHSYRPYPIHFIRYESFWKNGEQLLHELNLPNRKLPSKLKRRANWKSLPQFEKQKSNLMYGEFANFLKNLPDLFVLKNGKIHS